MYVCVCVLGVCVGCVCWVCVLGAYQVSLLLIAHFGVAVGCEIVDKFGLSISQLSALWPIGVMSIGVSTLSPSYEVIL